MKFEVRTKDSINKTYGIWNNDMQSFQYVYDWDGTETISYSDAIRACKELNKRFELNK